MEYNICKTCGANNGRAGLLINGECQNCHSTRKNEEFTVYANLVRTPEELNKTSAIINPPPPEITLLEVLLKQVRAYGHPQFGIGPGCFICCDNLADIIKNTIDELKTNKK